MITRIRKRGEEAIWRSDLEALQAREVVVLCDRNTVQYCYADALAAQLIPAQHELLVVEAGEASKSMAVATDVLLQMQKLGVGKSGGLLINLGGGMVCDLGGFCAHIYRRGIRVLNIPTTVLCMADASVGGKNGVDLEHVKNAVGSVHHPEAVFLDTRWIRTQDPRARRSGIAEIIKHALLQGEELFTQFASWSENDFYQEDVLLQGLQFKLQCVTQDPHDAGLRQILNFGHSIGHALESLAMARGQELWHGEAVMLGMLLELKLCEHILQLDSAYVAHYKALAHRLFPGLQLQARLEEILPYLQNDKKNQEGLRMSLLAAPGHCKPGIPVSLEQLKTVWHDAIIL